MLNYPKIDPISISLGPLQIHWYGLMYLVGFLAAWWLARRRALRLGLSTDAVETLIFYCVMGVILGGRLGYALFYGLDKLADNPLWLRKIWEGGMSFHGGFVGVLVAALVFARKQNLRFFQLTDFIAPLVPIGLGAGRIGNFINHELPGRVSDVPWAMVFPNMGPAPRHPSSLYEFALEGVVLFAVLWWFSVNPRRNGTTSGFSCCSTGFFVFLSSLFAFPTRSWGSSPLAG